MSFLRPLFASLTLAALATPALAIDISVPGTQTVTTTATGGITISPTGSIQTVTSSAIEFDSSSSVDNTLVNYSMLSSGVSATVAATLPGAGAVTISNHGNIIQNTPGAAAIDLSAMTSNGATVNNDSHISGSIIFSDMDDTLTNTDGTISGSINLGNGTNSVTFTGGAVTGNITGGTGANTFAISGSAITGDITTSTNNDVLTITNTTITGNVSTGNGANTVNLDGSTLNGYLQSGNGASVVTLTDSTVTGEISDTTVGGDADVLNIRGTAFTNQSGISGFETLNISATTFNLNQGLTGVSTLRNGTGSTFNVNTGFATASGGVINNSGTINLSGGTHVAADSFTSTGNLGVMLATSQTASSVSATVGDVNLAAGTLTIRVSNTAGFIASGTQYLIASGAGGATTSGTLTNASTGVYRYKTEVTGGNNLILTVGRVSTSSVVQGVTAQSIGNALDTIGANATGNLSTLQSIIGEQPDAAGVQKVVESFGPGLDGAAIASIDVTQATGNQVSQRLAMLRDYSTGIATGDPMASRRMWLQGFANHVDQDDKGGASGYAADASGGSLGIDTDNLMEGLTTGLAVSYGKTNVDSNSDNNASTGINSYVATLYGSKVFRQGTFLNMQIGGGYNDYDMERNVPGVGTANGSTNGWQATAKAELGHDISFGQTTFTPIASVQYTHLNMSDYTETGLGNASLHVTPGSMDTADLGAGARLAYSFPLANGGTFTPSMHAKYIYRLGDTNLSTTSQFIGGGGMFNTEGVETDRSGVNAGVGLLLSTVGGTDLSLDYAADIRSSFIGHAGQIKARWVF